MSTVCHREPYVYISRTQKYIDQEIVKKRVSYMRLRDYFLPTMRDVPGDAEIASHQYMLRAGMIRKVASGIYTWLPFGLRVLRKVERIVREEMDAIGAMEIAMPLVQPAALWEESGRISEYGPELLRFADRHARAFCLGPTHEEVVTDIVRNNVNSYKQLPVILYQIQNKFRDEIRPRFGVMRGREFVMKDAYSFHGDNDSLAKTYQEMYRAYHRIFSRIGLDFRAVIADTGSIGGNTSHEFHVLANTGEDVLAIAGDVAANVEAVPCPSPSSSRAMPTIDMVRMHIPENTDSLIAVAEALSLPFTQLVQATVVAGKNGQTIVLLLRADHTLNMVKVAKIPDIEVPVRILEKHISPLHTSDVRLIVDHAVTVMSDFACCGETPDHWYVGVNWERDIPLTGSVNVQDIRYVCMGDVAPDGTPYVLTRGIEVGHIFQLGDKYSRALHAQYSDENGNRHHYNMGCYGIGISRIVAATIEQCHDDNGIIWPETIAPFLVGVIAIHAHKSSVVQQAADTLYDELTAAGISALYDDRNERPGIQFADMDLIGLPHRIVISDRGLANGTVEYKKRGHDDMHTIPLTDIVSFLRGCVNI